MNRILFTTCLVVLLLLGPYVGRDAWSKKADFDVDYWLTELENRAPSGHRTPKGLPQKEHTGQGPKEGVVSPAKDQASDGNIKRISVDFYKMDLHNVFRLLGEISGKNIVVDESVSGTITLALKDVPWTFVLDVIKSLKGLSSVEKYNTIMIFPAGKKVAWGVKEKLGNKGALEVKKSPELVIPEIKDRPGLVVKKGYSLKTSLEAVEKARGLLKRARESERKGDVNRALRYYKRAADLWPDNEGLLKKIATLSLSKAHRELEAFNYAKMALKIDPKDSMAASLAGVALARMGRNDEAINYFERAVTSPDCTYETLYNYAVFLFSNGKHRDAIRILNRLEARFQLTPECILLKARSFEALGQKQKAIKQYITVVNGGEAIPATMKQFARSRLKELIDGADKAR